MLFYVFRNIFQDVMHKDTLVKSFIDEVSSTSLKVKKQYCGRWYCIMLYIIIIILGSPHGEWQRFQVVL